MKENICHFIPLRKNVHSIHTINFVLETLPQPYTKLKSEAVYKMYYVSCGQGYLHTPGKIIPLTKGNIFFTFPASPFAIESGEDFCYMYISFIGLRGNMILDSLNINNSNCLFHGTHEVQAFWEKGLLTNPKMTDWISESVLLYTFSYLGTELFTTQEPKKQNQSVSLIKKYVDDHFSSQNFSLETMSRELSYNPKYISHVFKKHFGIGIIEYLNTLRIQNACTLIEQGFTSVSHIADSCGYSDAAYFSRIFKGKMGVSPTQYIKDVQSVEKTDQQKTR